MAQLVTWAGMHAAARSAAGITFPGLGDNPANALLIMSKCRHQLQTLTNSVKRQLTITIASPSADGSYAEDLDVKTELDLQLKLTGQLGYAKVTLVTPEKMDEMKRDLASANNPIPPFGHSGEYFYTIEQGKLWLLPFVGITGLLQFRYIPNLAWFDPAQPTGDWASIVPTGSTSVETFMLQNGPDREFVDASGAISDYLAATLLESSGITRAFQGRYDRLLSSWTSAQGLSIRDTAQLNKETKMRPRNGPMI